MIVPIKKTQPVFRALPVCLLCLCALLAAPAFGVGADYTAGTPGGSGAVVIEPETGDRRVEVMAPPPAASNPQQVPVYVYPQVGRPEPHPAPPGPKPAPPRNR